MDLNGQSIYRAVYARLGRPPRDGTHAEVWVPVYRRAPRVDLLRRNAEVIEHDATVPKRFGSDQLGCLKRAGQTKSVLNPTKDQSRSEGYSGETDRAMCTPLGIGSLHSGSA